MNQKTISAVAKETGVTKDDVTKVVEALEALQTDPVVGEVRHNPATGDVAIFVRQYGETYWSVVSVEDRHWVEADTVGWDVLVDPAKTEAGAVVTTPGDAAVDPE
jgi:hypothetical protein